jgi:guanylate kinase
MKPSSSNPASPAPELAPLVIVLSGPSGAGKDAVLGAMKARGIPSEYVITNTTRARRPAEAEGHPYHFVSAAEFKSLLERGEMLEHAEVYGNYYGVPKAPVRQALAEGRDVLIKVDVQGALTIKKIIPGAVLVFLMPPSIDELSRRLNGRGTEAPRDLELRLTTARSEIEKLPEFDYVVVSYPNKLDRAVDDVCALITAEKLRVSPRQYKL